MQVASGKRVRLRVHLQAVGGDTIEDSVVEYVQGSGRMLPGLEQVLAGLEAGARKTGVLPAAQAFGDPSHSPHKRMKRSEFPEGARLTTGERFAAKGINGADVVLAIGRLDGDDVEVQLMHPLADKDLAFDVEILGVTDTAPPPMPAEALELKED